MSLLSEQRGPILILTINRPAQANALDPAAYAALGAAFVQAEHDDTVRAIIVTGAGERVFCAVMDLKAFAAGKMSIEEALSQMDVVRTRPYAKPIIAAVNGTAVGGGFEMMMACDLVVAAEHARFGIAEVKRGVVAIGGGVRLPARIPLAVALEMGLTGELIDARRAYELGLINRVLPGADVMPEALRLAGLIAANGPLAVAMTKRLMLESIGMPDLREYRRVTAPVFASADAREGALAFAEKRTPQFKGN